MSPVSNVYSNGKGIITFDVDSIVLFSIKSSPADSRYVRDSVTNKLIINNTELQARLTSITFPGSVAEVGGFSLCKLLKEVALPARLKTIQANAFMSCKSLTEINLPEGLEFIGHWAFFQAGIKSVVLNVPCEEGAFADSQLETVVIGDNLTNVPAGAFSGCRYLSKVELGKSIKSIDVEAFDGCSKLKSIDLPDGLESIGASAFEGTNLSSVVIPASCRTLAAPDEFPFNDCPFISISVAEGNPAYDSRNDCNAIIETATNTLLKGSAETIIPMSFPSFCTINSPVS